MTPPQNRDRNDLHPHFRGPLESWLAAANAWGARVGVRVEVYETHRTAARQAWLHASGRTRPGPILTQTLDSAHEYGVAADAMVLVWNPRQRAWLPDWSEAAYNRVYRAVPPDLYGLELLPWERPHLQLRGVNGPAQRTSVGVWARANGIAANAIVGSVWPARGPASPPVAPVPTPAPAAPSAPPVASGRLLAPDPSGRWHDLRGHRLELVPTGAPILVNAADLDGDIYLGGLTLPEPLEAP